MSLPMRHGSLTAEADGEGCGKGTRRGSRGGSSGRHEGPVPLINARDSSGREGCPGEAGPHAVGHCVHGQGTESTDTHGRV